MINNNKHNNNVRSKIPVTIIYIEGPYTRSEALKLEYE